MTELTGRVAVITGAGRGIGSATALAFARAGARIVIATRTREPGEETAAAIRAEGGEAEVVAMDVGERAAVGALIRGAAERYGRLDIVLHNAAYISHGDVTRLTEKQIDVSTDVNFKAAFWLLVDAAPYLGQSPAVGRLLFTSSIIGNAHSMAGYGLYGATKAGLNGLIRQAGLELAARNMTVNGVEPGVVQTQALSALGAAQLAGMRSMVPRGQLATPEDIAGALLFLASDSARHITGQTIVVDGGQSLGPVPRSTD
jgi:3-oxoacyl-[acyl-carrier protein] reductase